MRLGVLRYQTTSTARWTAMTHATSLLDAGGAATTLVLFPLIASTDPEIFDLEIGRDVHG
jgi:hypothetical protein